ncbi:hypothetical protein P7M47_01880 [Bisgaard Taxon 10/6]|uniref:hypothetical protein n=1 Tax=Exercitatus varius TaxID=67857 RepID=UPI00294B26E5|nr:hypothetical protein [Exercitatus varius]MDG2914731.1 hypothetical protein [Exercitatus varius]
MLDLSSIQEKHNEKYLTLEHLRAFIYKSKLEKDKTKGKNEKNFYGVTCAKDVLLLLQNALDSGNSISCYKQNINIGINEKVDYSEVKNYLTYLIIIDKDNTTIPYIDALNFYEGNKYDYLNMEFLFIREEIEKIIGAKIPYIENLSDIENSDLIPLQKEKSESVSELNQEIEKLKSELEEKQKIIDSLSLTNQSGRISSPQKQLFALLVKKCYPKLDSRNKLFDVINADLKESGIRNTNIAADTFYKLIDESSDTIKAIFPPKKL